MISKSEFKATSEPMWITPEMAQEFLDNHSGGNRNISRPVVESYAASMREGKWLLNGEPIVFDINDILKNGFHRCHAGIKAGVPFPSFVVRGVDPEVFTTFDCGRHRTVGQLIGMQGIKHYNSVASAVQLSYHLLTGYTIGQTLSAKRIRKSNGDMIEYFNKDRDMFIEAGRFAVEVYNNCDTLGKGVIGGMLHYLVRYGHYRESFVKEFFRQICSWDTCDNASLNIMRRRLCANKANKKEKMTTPILFALIIKAWNSYVTGSSLKVFKYDPEREDYPKLILKDIEE